MEKLVKTQASGRIKIGRERCKGCQLCVVSCPQRLICMDRSLNKWGVHPAYFKGSGCPPSPRLRRTIRRSLSEGGCTGCALCAQVCPECCIEVYRS